MSLADEFNAIPIGDPKTIKMPSKAKSLAAEFESIPTEIPTTIPAAYNTTVPVSPGETYTPTTPNQDTTDTWADKVRAGIEAGGGTLSTVVASIPGIPYGVFNGIYKAAIGQKRGTAEDEILGGIQAMTPNALLPSTDLGQKYMEDIGTALQGMPVLGAEGSAIGAGARVAGQFAKAKAGATLAREKPLAITPVQIASEAHNTSPSLHAEIVKHENAGTINPVIAQRHMDADMLPEVEDQYGNKVKVRLTKGMVTQDSKILSDERNERSVNEPVRQIMDENGRAMPLILDHFQKQVAPDINFRNAPEEGQFYIEKLKQIDDKLTEKTDASYALARETTNGLGLTHSPLDSQAWLKDVSERFDTMDYNHEDLPSSVRKDVEDIASGKKILDIKRFENFRKRWGAEQRAANAGGTDGSASAGPAISTLIDSLLNIPLTEEAKSVKPLFDAARSDAKLNFDLQKRSPAYKDVVSGKAVPDNFVDKYILGNSKTTATHQHVQNLINMFPDDDEMRQALAYSTLKDIKDRAVNSKGQLLSSKLNDAVTRGEDNGKNELLLQGTIKDGVNKEFPIRHGLDSLNKTAQLVQGMGEAGQYIQTNPNMAARLAHWVNSGAYKYAKRIPYIGEDVANIKQDWKLRKLATESTKPGAGMDYVPGQRKKESPQSLKERMNYRSPQEASTSPFVQSEPTLSAILQANTNRNEK